MYPFLLQNPRPFQRDTGESGIPQKKAEKPLMWPKKTSE
jgi:hypothetical protein